MKGIKESVQAEETEVGRSALPAGGRGELARAPTSPLGVRSGFSEMENCQQAGFKQGTGQVKVVERYSECRLKNANCVWRVLGPGTECPALCSCPVASDLGIFSLQTPYSVNVTVPESQLPNRPCLPHPCLAFSLRLRALLLCSQAAAAMEVKSSEQVLPFKTAILSPLCRRAV